jgi:hypothetical protein
VAVAKKSLADRVRVRVRHLAAEEANRKGGHGSEMLLPRVEISRPILLRAARDGPETR